MGFWAVFGPKTYGTKSRRLENHDARRKEQKRRESFKPRTAFKHNESGSEGTKPVR